MFYEQLGSSVHVVYSSRSSEDVTEQYTDIETRLATLTTKARAAAGAARSGG